MARMSSYLNNLEEESRMVFRNTGFVMIYTVVSEMSQSVPTPSRPIIFIQEKI